MKIVIINSKFDLKSNTGAEKFSKDLLENLEKKGHEVYLFSSFSENPDNGKFKNIYVAKNKLIRKLLLDYYNPFSKNSIEKELKKINPDIVHFNNFYGISTYAIKKVSEKYPTLITVHDGWPLCYRATFFNKGKIVCDGLDCKCYYPLSWLHKKIVRKHLKNIQLISPSNFLGNKLKRVFKNVKIINNGIDIPKEITNYGKNILFVGRITEEKGLQTIANSLDNLNTKVLVLGTGKLKNKLEGKYKNINFLGFKNPHKYYKKASILVIPSIWQENFPYSISEAMSYGLCVIGSNLGGIPEMIKNKKTGILFKANDEKDFNIKISNLLKEPNKIKILGKNARNYVKKDLNWNKIMTRYEKIYAGLLNEN
jgi:glycosyltransferase involved in cell wall biosynthesis